MDLLEVLTTRLESLPEGDYMPGLKAVVQHINVATKHLQRGQTSADETAFTDSIYRTNQAFEGSLKEAYRVLTGKNPAKETTNTIEQYLQGQNVLRERVLAQLTNYRREWRNPSTHDYGLDFDEDEALLAIVNVSVFAIVLIDQIIERISFNKARIVASESPSPSPPPLPLLEQVVLLLEQFVGQFKGTHDDKTDRREPEILGALSGFLSATAPELFTASNDTINHPVNRADFYLKSPEHNEHLLIEVKLRRPSNSRMIEDAAINQVISYMETSGTDEAIIFVYVSENSGRIAREERYIGQKKVLIVTTQ